MNVKGIGTDIVPGLFHYETQIQRYDFIEISPEHRWQLDDISRLKNMPVIAHAMSMSPCAGDVPLGNFISLLDDLVKSFNVRRFSDHLGFVTVNGQKTHGMWSPIYTEEIADLTVRRIKECYFALGLPFDIENVTTHFTNPLESLTEWSFLSKVAIDADIGISLNIANCVISAHFYNISPIDYLNKLPLDRIVSATLIRPGRRVANLIDNELQLDFKHMRVEILEYLFRHSTVDAVMLQRGPAMTPLDELSEDYELTRSFFSKYRSNKV